MIKKKYYSYGDYNWQLEAVTNIIKNAVEHSRDGGRVWINASKNDIYTEIVIRDEGEGMSEYNYYNEGKKKVQKQLEVDFLLMEDSLNQ